MSTLVALDDLAPEFPPPSLALTEPDGLLALGGNLSPAVLMDAYGQGIFPWYDETQPILWWSPSLRSVIEPGGIHISRSLAKVIRRETFSITTDQAFPEVIHHCASSRRSAASIDNEGLAETWITGEMMEAYCNLHHADYAHSVEVWAENELAGGLYGVVVGGVFCGESMFSLQANASKVALVALTNTLFAAGFQLIDCQIPNPHLNSMGAVQMPRENYLQVLKKNTVQRAWPKQFSAHMANPVK